MYEIKQVDSVVITELLTTKNHDADRSLFSKDKVRSLIEHDLMRAYELDDYIKYLKENNTIQSYGNTYDSEDIDFLLRFIEKAQNNNWYRSGIWNGYITGKKDNNVRYFIEFRNSFERIAKHPTWDRKVFTGPNMGKKTYYPTKIVSGCYSDWGGSYQLVTKPGERTLYRDRNEPEMYEILRTTGMNGYEIYDFLYRGFVIYTLGVLIRELSSPIDACGGLTDDKQKIMLEFVELCLKKHRGGFLWDDFMTQYQEGGYYVRNASSEIYYAPESEWIKQSLASPGGLASYPECIQKIIRDNEISMEEFGKMRRPDRNKLLCKYIDLMWPLNDVSREYMPGPPSKRV